MSTRTTRLASPIATRHVDLRRVVVTQALEHEQDVERPLLHAGDLPVRGCVRLPDRGEAISRMGTLPVRASPLGIVDRGVAARTAAPSRECPIPIAPGLPDDAALRATLIGASRVEASLIRLRIVSAAFTDAFRVARPPSRDE